jgi:hypothetical protein
MDEKERQAAFMSALTTEHFVLQTAANANTNEAGTRATLYIAALSSSLVAMGFASQSPEVFVPFVSIVLPAVFLLGVFTVVRLVDSNLESMRFLTQIARIRGYYRTLAPEGADHISAEGGRWPEAQETPALRLGVFVGFITTTPSMIAFMNSIVAGVGIALLAGGRFPEDLRVLASPIGVASAILLMVSFLAYQRWRYSAFDPPKS